MTVSYFASGGGRGTSTEDSKGLRTVDCRDSTCQRVAFILFFLCPDRFPFLHARSHFSNFYHGTNILLTTELNSRNGSSLLLFLSNACDSTEELLSLSAMRTAISSMLGKKKIGLWTEDCLLLCSEGASHFTEHQEDHTVCQHWNWLLWSCCCSR